jgi:hypothetical protein
MIGRTVLDHKERINPMTSAIREFHGKFNVEIKHEPYKRHECIVQHRQRDLEGSFYDLPIEKRKAITENMTGSQYIAMPHGRWW